MTGKGKGLVMGYFDGNTVTALWNYAQNFAMNDNSYGTTFGPSTPGLLNLVAGNTYPATPSAAIHQGGAESMPGRAHSSAISIRPAMSARATPHGPDRREEHRRSAERQGRDLGRVHGRLRPDRQQPQRDHRMQPAEPRDPRQWRPDQRTTFRTTHSSNTSRRQQTRTTRGRIRREAIGTSNDGGANHQYDLHDFFDALAVGNMPAVSFLKAIAAEDGHAGYSDPLLEQSISWSRRSMRSCGRRSGRARRSSSCMTIRTAGTTIR